MFAQLLRCSAGIDSDEGSSDDEEFTEGDAKAAEANMSGDDDDDDDDDWAGSASDDEVRPSALSTSLPPQPGTCNCPFVPASAFHPIVVL